MPLPNAGRVKHVSALRGVPGSIVRLQADGALQPNHHHLHVVLTHFNGSNAIGASDQVRYHLTRRVRNSLLCFDEAEAGGGDKDHDETGDVEQNKCPIEPQRHEEHDQSPSHTLLHQFNRTGIDTMKHDR